MFGRWVMGVRLIFQPLMMLNLCHAAGMAPKSKSKKNSAAVALGRLGGLKGGPALAAKLTAAQRKASARRAALARWSKRRK